MAEYKVISADSHLNEPQEVYDRLPAEYRARAPRIEVRDDQRYIIVEGQGPARIEAPNPLKEDDMNRYWRDNEEVGRVMHRAGGTDIPLRLTDQETDGVSAEVIYPHGTFHTFSSKGPRFPAGAVQSLQRLLQRSLRPAPRPLRSLRGRPNSGYRQCS